MGKVDHLMSIDLYHGDCLEILPTLEENSIDAVVTDPPYFLLNDAGAGFMNKEWDSVSSLWRHLWLNKEFVSSVEKFLLPLQVELIMEEEFTALENACTVASENAKPSLKYAPHVTRSLIPITKIKNFVPLIVFTKQSLLDSLKEELGNNLSSFLSGVKNDALFVVPILLPNPEHKSIVGKSVFTYLKANKCQEKTITFTKMEMLAIKDAIEGVVGESLGSKYTSVITGLVDTVESTAKEKRFSATILSPIMTGELTKQLTLLLYATLVTHTLSNISQNLIENFFRLVFKEVLRVMKPGAHLLAFGGTRTYHRMVCAIEDAGFEIKDQIQWLFAGLPKSHNLKGEWEGWGTGLKPANEPLCLARKPLGERTVAANMGRWGTGAINIDAGRIPLTDKIGSRSTGGFTSKSEIYHNDDKYRVVDRNYDETGGRWPANVIISHHPECKLVGEKEVPGYVINRWVDGAKPFGGGAGHKYKATEVAEKEVVPIYECHPDCPIGMLGDKARFYYCPKVGKRERGTNKHITAKPLALMEYLCKLITPSGGVILDPFAGSGSTGVAAKRLGYGFVGIEKEKEYFETAKERLQCTVILK